MSSQNKIGQRIFVFLIFMLFFNLPLVQALEISNVRAEEISQNSAVIAWETDEPANSFVEYGTQPAGTEPVSLQRRGDAASLLQHRLELRDLSQETEYLYKVESSGVVDDNGGNLYTFSTLPPDTQAPELFVVLPEIVQEAQVDISGSTEAGATVKIKVNGVERGSVTATANAEDDTEDISGADENAGEFTFELVALTINTFNVITVEASDVAGNIATFTGAVFSDTQAPRINLPEIPALVLEKTFQLNGTVSENVSIEFFVNERSAGKAGSDAPIQAFSQNLVLEEGLNTIRILAKDKAGWETSEERTLYADTLPPQVKFELSGGTEYFEGRAETDIVGETEAGAMVYLYVYHVQADQFKPDFGRAIEKTTANSEGKFNFTEVEFPPPPFSSLEQLAPREVPQGLQDILIPGQGELAQQRKAYRVYVIVEDKSGKNNFAERTINVNSCTSGEFAFQIQSVFETPFRLNPSLMEQGMQDIAALFNLTYVGSALGSVSTTGIIEPPFKIQQVQFQKACTQKMIDAADAVLKKEGLEAGDLDLLGISLGCKLLPSSGLRLSPSVDKTALYATQRLQRAADFIKREENIWDDLKNRKVKFPLKIQVQYQEREPSGAWSATKTQVECYDMGYAIDVPIESDEFLPDEMAKDLVNGLNDTISVITSIEPVLQTAMQIAGGSCVVSWIVKLGAKYYRIFESNFESVTSGVLNAVGKKELKCPDTAGQRKLYLKSTLDTWRKNGIGDRDPTVAAILALDPEKLKEITLEEKCPSTASAWEFEASVDAIYKFTCDRFLCRTVPAGWTETAPQQEVDRVEQEQVQCAASGICSPLTLIEQCEKHLQRVSTENIDFIKKQKDIPELGSFPCYLDSKGVYYYVDQRTQTETGKGIWKLTPVVDVAGRLGDIPEAGKFAYKPEGSETFCVGIDTTCQAYCEKRAGYTATDDGFHATGSGPFTPDAKKSCYVEQGEGDATTYSGSNGATLSNGKYRAGYTKDCFIDGGERYQCVCKPSEKLAGATTFGAREASEPPTDGTGVLEEWDYQQDKVYAESQGTAGTLYPKWRYYSGRDFTAAFGQNTATDILFGTDGHYSNTKISPRDYVGSFQTMCLTKINANLQELKSQLIGLQACIVEAENNGLFDAGTCKNLFSQAVCGLIYKGIAYLASSCSPLSVKDLRDEVMQGSDEDVAAFFSSGFKAIPEAMQASIDEVNADYGDAKVREFFSAGAQGFAEKICLAAFGFDFPTLSEFVEDVAYASSTNVDPMFITANRELVSFDPSKGKSVHSYELGGFVLPGCKLRGYTTELKCIGPEDLGNPGVDQSCGGAGCDCLSATENRPEFSSERSYRVASGSKFGDIQKGGLLDLPIQSPERVTSSFRYDHVVFTVQLDKFEDPEQCLESQYRKGNTGVWYFPIKDITPPGILACEVHTVSGRFICPQITSLFGVGQNYFEAPYIQCVDPRSGESVPCDMPNLYIANENENNKIVIKPYLNLGSQASCLRIVDNRKDEEIIRIPLPENAPGPRTPQIPIGTITEEMIKGSGEATMIKVAGKSDPGCGGHGIGVGSGVEVIARPPAGSGGGAILEFTFAPQTGTNTYIATIKAGSSGASGIGIDTSRSQKYTIDASGALTFDGNQQLTKEQINSAFFTFNGFIFTNVFGSPTKTERNPPNFVCTYQTLSGSSTTDAKVGSMQIRAEILLPGANENCFTTRTLAPRSSFGQPFAETTIRIQAERTEEKVVEDMYTDFKHKNYVAVEMKTKAILSQKINSLEHATARYYQVAAAVLQGNEEAVLAGLNSFFKPQLNEDTDYSSAVKDTEEYKKIEKYMCEVRAVYDYNGEETETVGKCST